MKHPDETEDRGIQKTMKRIIALINIFFKKWPNQNPSSSNKITSLSDTLFHYIYFQQLGASSRGSEPELVKVLPSSSFLSSLINDFVGIDVTGSS